MEAPPVREGAFSPEAAYYIDKLARKEEECNEILAQFNKYKVKTKVRFDQLRHEISNILHERDVDPEDERHQPAMLLVSLNETQFRLEEAEKVAEVLRSDVEQQQLHINDQIILIKNVEDQLRDWEESEYARERRRNEPVDMEKVQQQMMYKDERIVELNSVILDKERQILDLQDACRSASEVATSKKEAMRIVQKKFDDMEKRTRREASTETDERLTGMAFDGTTNAATNGERMQRPALPQVQLPQPQRATRTSSPGRAVHVVSKNGCSSPPPLDPSELDDLPGTSKLAKTNVDGDSNMMREKKQRKRVTFDLPQAASREDISRLTADADSDEITDAIVTLTAENERLRTEMERIERESEEMAVRLAKAESSVTEAEREARHASLKARAVAQARIKELEDRMASQNAQSGEQIERLQVETETLRSTRDWEVEQNARMREQLGHTKEKLRQLREELDASAQANRTAEKKMNEKEELMVSLVSELEDAESLAVFLEDQKHQILDDVDKLRDAMQLYEEYIELLEADIVIYETRVGNLREELGVSKMNQRDHIKSKAFNTKLQMINKEKEQIDRKANDERLRTKALHAKVQILEAENEKLMGRLCEAEMAGEDTSSIDAACKQLQSRMEMAEAETARARADYESRLKAAEFASESLREECDRLRAERDNAEQHNVVLQQQQMQLQQNQYQTQLHLQQQPGCSMQQQQAAASSSSLDAALRLAQSAQESLTRERDELAERVHVLGGENFELTTRTEEAEREVERLESCLTQLESRLRESAERETSAEMERMRREERRVEREEELIELRGRVAERETTVERMEIELKRLRSELDHAHLAMAESAAVKREVQQLQQQMELEREAAAVKWQQVAQQLKSYEELASNSGWDSRKTSTDETATVAAAAELRAARAEAEAAAVRQELRELQQMQHVTEPGHELQHAQLVEQETPLQVASVEDEDDSVDRHEMDRTRARIEELESEVELSHELNVESGRTVQALQQRIEKIEHERRLLETLTVEFSEDLADMKEGKTAASAAPAAAAVNVQPEEDEEVVEMRRRLEELEEEAAVSEELHVEMGRTVQVLEGRIREMEMERRLHEMMNVELTSELQELRQQQPAASTDAASAAEIAAAAAEHDAALNEQLQNERMQRARDEEATRAELQRLQMALYAAEDARREVTRQLAEKEQTESLVRATAATFDAVAVAAAPSVAAEPVPKIIHPESAAGAAAVAAVAAEVEEEERATLVQENVLLREAVYQNVRHQESVTSDVARLLELKEELEKAVEALRGEIWSLNGQLKASVLDRENLQDRVVELDTKVALEKRRADLLDSELAEQMELRENAQRQAAEAENESNRRLAECAEMDGKREDLEKAYALLAGYYSQLQEAYNVLYTQQQQQMVLQQQQNQQLQQNSGEGVPREDRSTRTGPAAEASTSSISSISVTTGAAPVAASSRRAMAEAYASRLSALRELSVQLTKSVLATELATLESELDNSITSIEGLSGTCPEAGASVDALLDAIIQDYDGSSGVSADARAKIASVHSMLRAKISEVERVHSALREQRGVCSALEERLTELEAAGPPHGLAGPSSPGTTTSSTAPSELEERIEECEALRAHVEQLQEIISRYVSREEAGRLATREADVDSLFKTNAELAHENVRLQNEMDERGEEREKEERRDERPELVTSSTQTQDGKEFDEAELELIREELEEEREARKKEKKRRDEREKELMEQKAELEDTIVDLSMKMTENSNAAPVGEVGDAADEEEKERAAAAAAAELSSLRGELDREKKTREEVEKELRKTKEEMEGMRNERQLMEAEGSEMNEELKEERAAKNEAEKEKTVLQEQLKKMEETKKEEEEEGDGWGEEKRQESSSEVELLRLQLQQEKEGREAAEEKLQQVEKEKMQLQQEREKEKKEEEKIVRRENEDNGWGEEWEEEEEKGEVEKKEDEKKKEEEEEDKEKEEMKIRVMELEAGVKDLSEQLTAEWETKEEMEENMKMIEKEKKRLMMQLKHEENERNVFEREMREKMREWEETKKEEEEEGDGWGEGWGEEKGKKPKIDELSSQLSQLRMQLQQETAARTAAERKRDELQLLQGGVVEEEETGWGEDWGEEKSTTADVEKKLRLQLQQEKWARERAEQQLQQAEVQRVQLREELEKEKKRKEETESHFTKALKEEIAELEDTLAQLKEVYKNRLEDLESAHGRARDNMVKYEHIIHGNEEKIRYLEEKIAALEVGRAPPPPPPEDDDSDGGWSGDGWIGPQEEKEEGEEEGEEMAQQGVFNILENPNDQPDEDEVVYSRNYYQPEDPDEVSELFHELNSIRDEAADLQEASRHGGAPAQQRERIGLRFIVKKMADKLQELEDEYFNDSGHLKELLRIRDIEVKVAMDSMCEARAEVNSLKEAADAAGAAEAVDAVDAVRMEEEKEEERKEEKAEMERLKKQNSLLQESEAKLTECVDTSNQRIEEAETRIESLRQQLEEATVAAAEKLREAVQQAEKKMKRLEAAADAKESQLMIARRETEEAREAQKGVEERLNRMIEASRKKKEAAAAARGNAAGPAPSNRSYVGGPRRTSTASSVLNEETREVEEKEEEEKAIRVDHGRMDEQIDFGASSSSTVGDTPAFRRRGGNK